MGKILQIGRFFIGIGLICELLSILFFNGFASEWNAICGSACEIWPGIKTGEICILSCVIRNPYYHGFFYLGLVFLALGIVLIMILKRKEKFKGKKEPQAV